MVAVCHLHRCLRSVGMDSNWEAERVKVTHYGNAHLGINRHSEQMTADPEVIPKLGYVRVGHVYVSQRQGKSAGVRGALGRARIDRIRMRRFASVASRLLVPAVEQNQTSICSLGLRRAVAED